MEKILDQSPAAISQDERLNMNSVLYDAAVVSPVKSEVSELNYEERSEKNVALGDAQVLRNCESPVIFEEPTEKVSPTIFESALKVMKTLFSPEKAKNKTSNSVNQSKGALESSGGSYHLPNKQKLINAETELEIHVMKSPLPEENDLKDKKQLTIPMLSPLTLDLQNNDDDSFLTTISYDESFQSAVTHFDENGEMTKAYDNLSSSVFNNSQDLDAVESCNSSLENSECCLENTMLKNDSTSLKQINHNGFTIKNTNGNNDQNKDFDHNNDKASNADCSYQASGVEAEVSKANDIDSFTQANNKLVRKHSDLNDEFTAVNGISNASDSHDSEINFGGMVSKKENQVPDEVTGPGFQLLETAPKSRDSSNNENNVKTVQENKDPCTENKNWDNEEMKNIKADDEIKISAEKSVLQSRLESPTPHLSKSDLNEVDEMLLALKNESGTITSMNSFNRNFVVFTGTGSSCFMKSSDFIYIDKKSKSTRESIKPERFGSPDISKSDKPKGFSHQKISPKCLEESYVFEETQPSLIFSTNRETGKPVESQKHPNQLKLNDSAHFNMKCKKVSASSNEELNFEKRSTCSTSVTPKNSTISSPKERSVISPHRVPVSNSLNISPLTATNNEVVGNNDGSETKKFFVGEGESTFSLKHSTPVSALHNDGSVCSSNQKNSLGMNEGNGDQINSELRDTSSDFLSKAMGILFEPSNPSISAENFSSGSLALSPKPTKEFNGSPPTKNESHKPGTPMQTYKENSPSSNRISLPCEINHSTIGQKKVFEEKFELPECDQTVNSKPDIFDPEKLDVNKTEVLDNRGDNVLNLTFNKKNRNKTEKKKPGFLNEMNDIYNNESNAGKDTGCDINDVNKIPEKNFTLGFLNDKERSGLSESEEAYNYLSPLKEPPPPVSQTFSISANESLRENMQGTKNIDCFYINDENQSFLSGSFSLSPSSGNSSLLKNQMSVSSSQVTENLSGKLNEIHETSNIFGQLQDERILSTEELNAENYETVFPSVLPKDIEPDVAQLIEQQFTPNDIAKICDIANLSETLKNGSMKANEDETEIKGKNVLSPKSFDFLSSIQGKPTGRDLSRESLYVKFDPLVQPSTANSLIDFSKEVEALAATESSPANHSSSICEELLAISPEKKSDVIVPPLTPLSDRNKKKDKVERQRDLQNEIYFLKNLYSERERVNKAKMEEYESQIAKLTGDRCVLEDKLKEYAEREKCIVKKMTAQTRDIEQLKIVMKEYVKVITVLTTELETLRKENAKEIETLTAEKESYMNHLLNTEAAFSDVHTKYEKSKKTIESLKVNEILYRNTISEHAQKMEEYKKKAKEAQEKAVSEFQNIMVELQESKNSHSQEVSRLRAQLKKTELKLEALQESLDQKIKENQQLTAICDELIEGRK